MRREVSFLLSEGHPSARHYPLCMLWRESDIARARFREQAVTNSILLQNAMGSTKSKAGLKNYQKLIKELSDNGEAD
mgnify:CR=1 FL=1